MCSFYLNRKGRKKREKNQENFFAFIASFAVNLLAAALTIALGLIGINALHAVEKLARVGTVDFGFGRPARIIAAGLLHRFGRKRAAQSFIIGLKEIHKTP
jgi:hypothetical protein